MISLQDDDDDDDDDDGGGGGHGNDHNREGKKTKGSSSGGGGNGLGWLGLSSKMMERWEMVNSMRGVIDQIVVPPSFARHTYGQVVVALIEQHGVISLGLYRPTGTQGSTLPFTLINPHPDTLITEKDMMFILRPPLPPPSSTSTTTTSSHPSHSSTTSSL